MNYKFDEYYKTWDKHGVKLTSRIEITKDHLDQVTEKPDVCDVLPFIAECPGKWQ